MGHLVGLVGHAYGVEDGTDAFGTLLTAVHAGGTEHKVEIVLDRAVGEQLEVLEDDSDAAAQGGHLSALEVDEVIAEHLGLAGNDGHVGIHRLQQRRLAGADLADDIYELALAHLERNVFQHKVIASKYLDIFVVYQRHRIKY